MLDSALRTKRALQDVIAARSALQNSAYAFGADRAVRQLRRA